MWCIVHDGVSDITAVAGYSGCVMPCVGVGTSPGLTEEGRHS